MKNNDEKVEVTQENTEDEKAEKVVESQEKNIEEKEEKTQEKSEKKETKENNNTEKKKSNKMLLLMIIIVLLVFSIIGVMVFKEVVKYLPVKEESTPVEKEQEKIPTPEQNTNQNNNSSDKKQLLYSLEKYPEQIIPLSDLEGYEFNDYKKYRIFRVSEPCQFSFRKIYVYNLEKKQFIDEYINFDYKPYLIMSINGTDYLLTGSGASNIASGRTKIYNLELGKEITELPGYNKLWQVTNGYYINNDGFLILQNCHGAVICSYSATLVWSPELENNNLYKNSDFNGTYDVNEKVKVTVCKNNVCNILDAKGKIEKADIKYNNIAAVEGHYIIDKEDDNSYSVYTSEKKLIKKTPKLDNVDTITSGTYGVIFFYDANHKELHRIVLTSNLSQ